jgi:tetratricopeptide (TPR) repeat protein
VQALAAKKKMDDAINVGDLAAATKAFAELPPSWAGTADAKATLDAVRKGVVDDAVKTFDAAMAAKDYGKARSAVDDLKLAQPKHPKLSSMEKRLASAEKAEKAADKAEKTSVKKKPEAEPEAATSSMSPQEAQEKARGLVREATGAFMSGDLATSLEKLKEAKQLSPRMADVHRNLGVVYARLGEKEAAYKAYKQFLELQPSGEEAEKVRAIVEQYEAAKGGK